jgi:hypothetical protein
MGNFYYKLNKEKLCLLSFLLAVALTMLGAPSLAFASTIDYEDESEEEEECKEESDYPSLCSGSFGVSGKPFCDMYNATERAEFYPNATKGCWDRTTLPIAFCKAFDDLTDTYEYCREVPESQEYLEAIETGGPDESCLFDVYQEKCLPSPVTGECPEGFGRNEDGYCFPRTFINGKWEWECPESYHSTEGDESGQCYPDTEPCYPGHLSSPNTTNCSDEEYVCKEFKMTGCMVDGKMIGTFPDEYCLQYPDNERCAVDKNFDCPEEFVTSSSSNFTNARCVPLSFEDVEHATRERQIHDQNRCPEGYNLEDIDEEPEEEYGNVGKCVPTN